MVQETTSPRPTGEPLLEENPERFCMFPIKYRDVWEMYKKAEASFWTGEQPSDLNRCAQHPVNKPLSRRLKISLIN